MTDKTQEDKVTKAGVHLSHCNQGEYVGSCKYGHPEDCPALAQEDKMDMPELEPCPFCRSKNLITVMEGEYSPPPYNTYDTVICGGCGAFARAWFWNTRADVPAQPDESVIDIDKINLNEIYKAASESKWMPANYVVNDWVGDVCTFLRQGPTAFIPAQPVGDAAEALAALNILAGDYSLSVPAHDDLIQTIRRALLQPSIQVADKDGLDKVRDGLPLKIKQVVHEYRQACKADDPCRQLRAADDCVSLLDEHARDILLLIDQQPKPERELSDAEILEIAKDFPAITVWDTKKPKLDKDRNQWVIDFARDIIKAVTQPPVQGVPDEMRRMRNIATLIKDTSDADTFYHIHASLILEILEQAGIPPMTEDAAPKPASLDDGGN